MKQIITDYVIPQFVAATDPNIAAANEFEQNILSEFSSFTSEFKTFNLFKNNDSFIEPYSKSIGIRKDFIKKKGIRTFSNVECKAQYIPLKVFFKMFSLQNVLKSTISYLSKLKSQNVVENFVQSAFWRPKLNQFPEKIIIPYFIFFDDFETGNALGSRSGIHKVGAIYCNFPCLAVDFKWGTSVSQSSLDKMVLVAIFHAADRVEFGNEKILEPIIHEINYLKNNGIHFDISPFFKGTIFFEMGLFLSDNLGISQIISFQESFSKTLRCCRYCRMDKNDRHKACAAKITLLRNMTNYYEDLALNRPEETGIKKLCALLKIDGFDIFNWVAVDLFHDLYQGVGKYVLRDILVNLIKTKSYFNITTFNDRLQEFDFGPDSSSKPVAMTIEKLTRTRMIKQEGSGVACLIQYLGLIIGEFVPIDDPFWILYSKLYAVHQILSRKSFSSGLIDSVRTAVEELNETYLECTKSHLLPKFHFLTHYPEQIGKHGPPILYSTIRFEAKHRLLKNMSNVSASRINVTYTLAKKHQLYLNKLFAKRQFDDPLHCQLLNDSVDEITTKYQDVIDTLQIDVTQSCHVAKHMTFYSSIFKRGTVIVAFHYPKYFEVSIWP